MLYEFLFIDFEIVSYLSRIIFTCIALSKWMNLLMLFEYKDELKCFVLIAKQLQLYI